MIINMIGDLVVNHTGMVFLALIIIVGVWTIGGILGGWRDWHTRY